jgi:hypothetical protein
MDASRPKNPPEIEDLLPAPPTGWPWALPYYYCVATSAAPGEDVVAYSARKDGTGEARIENVLGRTRVTLIGYWRGVYAVANDHMFLKREDAEKHADGWFAETPIRFRFRDGELIETNEDVELTGDWPTKWTFRRYHDFGSLCACLFEELGAGGHHDEGRLLKALLHRTTPGTEAVHMFHVALTNARNNWASLFSASSRTALDEAIAALVAAINH